MTEHELKGLKNIGAELGAAKAENEKLRGLISQALEFTEANTCGGPDVSLLIDRMRAALSQQAEPVEPAPAQDELWAVHAQGPDELYAAFDRDDAEQHAAALNALPMPAGIQVSATVIASPWSAAEHWKYLAEQEREHAAELKARAAQTEQHPTVKECLTVQPMAYAVFAANGNGACLSTQRDHPSLVALEADGHSVVSLAPIAQTVPQGKFSMGDLVKKSTGSEWEGRIVGTYSTEQTPEGYAVESSAHRGSVQIYPAKALEAV